MKDLKAIKGKYYLQRIISEGEHETQDFKFAISDAGKIARSISAFANNSGGRLLIGVRDNGSIAGVRNEEDIYVIEQAALMYCRPPQNLKFTAFSAGEGAVVIQAEIPPAPKKQVQAREPDGSWHAYYRVADENILAPALMVKAWRHKFQSAPAYLEIGIAEQMLLDIIRDEDSAVTISGLMARAHISRSKAEHTICNLYALGIIGFRFSGNEFAIVRHTTDNHI